MQKKIIVPIDFSAIAHNAYLYARELAKIYGATIEVVHIYQEHALNLEAMEISKIERQLKNFVQRFPEESTNILIKVEVQIKVLIGDLIPTLIALSNSPDSYLIVMGTKKYHSIKEQLYGTKATGIATLAACPVLLIPKAIKFRSYRNILFASNQASVDHRMIQQIKDFAHIYLAAIHFIHVKASTNATEIEEIEDRIFKQLFEQADPAFSFNIATIPAANVVAGLNQYAMENDIDLIVLVNKNHQVFNCINTTSTTKEMSLNLENPLLVYHLPEA